VHGPATEIIMCGAQILFYCSLYLDNFSSHLSILQISTIFITEDYCLSQHFSVMVTQVSQKKLHVSLNYVANLHQGRLMRKGANHRPSGAKLMPASAFLEGYIKGLQPRVCKRYFIVWGRG